jgi:hypothetical protein
MENAISTHKSSPLFQMKHRLSSGSQLTGNTIELVLYWLLLLFLLLLLWWEMKRVSLWPPRTSSGVKFGEHENVTVRQRRSGDGRFVLSRFAPRKSFWRVWVEHEKSISCGRRFSRRQDEREELTLIAPALRSWVWTRSFSALILQDFAATYECFQGET